MEEEESRKKRMKVKIKGQPPWYRNELVKKAFWKFPFLDGILALIIAVISVLSVSEKTNLFVIPVLVALLGFLFILGTPRTYKKKKYYMSREEAIRLADEYRKDVLYAARAIIISVLAALIILIFQTIRLI